MSVKKSVHVIHISLDCSGIGTGGHAPIIKVWGLGYIIYIDLLPYGAGLCPPPNKYFLPMPLPDCS